MDPKSIEDLTKAIQQLNKTIVNQDLAFAKQGPVEILLSILPLIGIVFGCTLLFFFMLWRYKQNKELIKNNKYQITSYQNLRTWCLLMGCLSSLIGFPMTILFLIMALGQFIVLGGLIPFFAGVGFLLFYFLTRSKD